MKTTFTRIAAVLALAIGLTACGSSADRSPLLLMSKVAIDRFTPGGPGTAIDARSVVTPQFIAASDASLLLVVQLDQDTSFTMIPQAANLGTVQWRTGSNAALLRRDGIVVGSRGFGFDLMTADVAGLDAAFDTNGAQDVLRVSRFLTSEGKIVTNDYLCDVRMTGQETLNVYGKLKRTRLFEEDCRATGGDFVNRYWVEGDGTVRRSIERISPELGYFDILRLTE